MSTHHVERWCLPLRLTEMAGISRLPIVALFESGVRRDSSWFVEKHGCNSLYVPALGEASDSVHARRDTNSH
jgi:hypothetical protein